MYPTTGSPSQPWSHDTQGGILMLAGAVLATMSVMRGLLRWGVVRAARAEREAVLRAIAEREVVMMRARVASTEDMFLARAAAGGELVTAESLRLVLDDGRIYQVPRGTPCNVTRDGVPVRADVIEVAADAMIWVAARPPPATPEDHGFRENASHELEAWRGRFVFELGPRAPNIEPSAELDLPPRWRPWLHPGLTILAGWWAWAYHGPSTTESIWIVVAMYAAFAESIAWGLTPKGVTRRS